MSILCVTVCQQLSHSVAPVSVSCTPSSGSAFGNVPQKKSEGMEVTGSIPAVRSVKITEKAIAAMDRVMNAPQNAFYVPWYWDSDWVRTPKVKGGRLRRRMYTAVDLPVPRELEDL